MYFPKYRYMYACMLVNTRVRLQVANGRSALLHCEPDALKLLEAVADVTSDLASGSLAETWLRMGTRLHDLVTFPPDTPLGSPNDLKSAIRCRHSGATAGWEQVLLYSRRCILTGMRLLTDMKEAPRAGTHGGLSMGRALMHPCAIFSPSSSAQRFSSLSCYVCVSECV